MAATEWYRKEHWTSADAADFFAHLSRTRKWKRAQYLRIQALHLAKTGSRQMLGIALDLLDLMLREYPDKIELCQAHYQRAECLEELGRLDEAEEAYRAALAAMRAFPNVRTDAHLDFALFALRRRRENLYAEVLAGLEEFTDTMPFPYQVYKYSLAKALLLAHQGAVGEARLLARRAMAEAARTTTDLSHHQHLGLVRRLEQPLHDELRKLAESW